MIKKILLGLVLVFFLFTRIYKIAEIPPSVYWDEASIGYNAFSIATDLKDEWGEFLPLHFRAFGEFKLPVYIYSVSFFIKVLGLTDFAVRLPAVFYSLGSILVLYLLVEKITGKDWVGILAAFILSVSPWLFIFSRTGYEASAGLFFFLLGNYFLISLDKSKWYVLLGTFSFIFSLFSYNSFRIIIPIWVLAIFICFARNTNEIRKYLKVIAISLSIFLVSLIPVYRLYRLDFGAVRLSTVGLERKSDFLTNYLSHFSYDFLFGKGDTNPRSQIPGRGQLYLIEIPLIIFGIFTLVKSKNRFYKMVGISLLVSPIAASLTRESPHALRAILGAPTFAVISSIGVLRLADTYKKYSAIILGGVIIAYLISFESYFSEFLFNYSNKSASAWQHEYKEIFGQKSSGTITDKYAQPYIFALYYLKYPPEKFRATVKYNPPNDWGFSTVRSFGEFNFQK